MVNFGEGKYRINLKYLEIGDDLVVIITGGDKHIGAVTLFENCNLLSISKVGHKEDKITDIVAPMIYKKLQRDVVVICGIHIKNATKNEIEILVQNSISCVKKFLKDKDWKM